MQLRNKLRTSGLVQQRARELRKQLTPAESLLWEHLRSRKLQGFKFRRQAPVDHYIVDFYCPACRLLVELDGDVHEMQRDIDQERTTYLECKGYEVMRFRNEEVEENIQIVLAKILTACRTPRP